jgi:hypothetical protein
MHTVIARDEPKLVVVLDAASVAALRCPEGGPVHVRLSIQCPSRVMHCEVAATAVRKAQATIREHGIDRIAAQVEGRPGAHDSVVEVDLIVQPKIPKAEPADDAVF